MDSWQIIWRERERERERYREWEREIQRERERESETDRESEREREIQRDRERERERERERDGQNETQNNRYIEEEKRQGKKTLLHVTMIYYIPRVNLNWCIWCIQCSFSLIWHETNMLRAAFYTQVSLAICALNNYKSTIQYIYPLECFIFWKQIQMGLYFLVGNINLIYLFKNSSAVFCHRICINTRTFTFTLSINVNQPHLIVFNNKITWSMHHH